MLRVAQCACCSSFVPLPTVPRGIWRCSRSCGGGGSWPKWPFEWCSYGAVVEVVRRNAGARDKHFKM
eukprot:3646074-Pyramimonas_sp.AAC.1